MNKKGPSSKLCIRCNKVLPFGDFYPNKGWADQACRDVWCKECVAKYCKDKETQAEYCHDNNRQWKDSFWDTASKKAKYVQATDPEYISPRTSAKKRQEIENRTTCRQFFSLMNLGPFYYFTDTVGGGDGQPAPKAKDEDSAQLKYNKEWRGYFTDEQVEALEDIYAKYEEDFVLDNVNIKDYARKVAKASLNADIAEDRMRRGKISAGEYKEAQKIFDDLSKSSNFAACRRKPGESSGMGSLGEIIMRLEVAGELKENGFTFPEDDVDLIIKDFRHTLRSVGLDGQL